MNSQLSTVKGALQAVNIVAYLTPDEVKRVVIASNEGRHGPRDSLLIKTLFETGLRISEALSLTPRMIGDYEGHAVLYIIGKGGKPRMVACPDDLAHEIRSYAYLNKIDMDQRIWDINASEPGRSSRKPPRRLASRKGYIPISSGIRMRSSGYGKREI